MNREKIPPILRPKDIVTLKGGTLLSSLKFLVFLLG